MKKLLLKAFLFTSIFIAICSIIYSFLNGFLSPKRILYDKLFTKINQYELFIKNRKSTNLILGSSLAEYAIIPESLGENWFSFTNASTNVHENYIFLKRQIDNNVKLDSIILIINPFDFPNSYIENRDYDLSLPIMNGGYGYFDLDSITRIKKESLKKRIQAFKNIAFPNVKNILLKNKNNSLQISKQGYSGSRSSGKNIDSLVQFGYIRKQIVENYFYEINKKPNFSYFNNFDSYIKSKNIKVFYVITPKTQWYLKELKTNNTRNLTWNYVKSKLNDKSKNFMDAESFFTKDSIFFHDETHLSLPGAVEFSKQFFAHYE